MQGPEHIPNVHDGAFGAPPLLLKEGESARVCDVMTPYERAQVQVAEGICRMRELLTQLDEMGSDVAQISRLELCQKIHRMEREAKLELRNAERSALREGRGRDFELLSYHFKKTLDLWLERQGGGLFVNKPTDDAAEKASVFVADSGSVVKSGDFLSLEPGNVVPHRGGGYCLQNDVEFMQFFQNIRKNDAVIDEALDNIYSGVYRLKENATLMTSELHLQEQVLKDTEKKMDDVRGKLTGLSKRLKKVSKKMDWPRMTVYLFCCVILAVVIVVIYVLAQN